jgi:hypothetical protein
MISVGISLLEEKHLEDIEVTPGQQPCNCWNTEGEHILLILLHFPTRRMLNINFG